MKYKILYDPKAEKQLDKLPRTITKRIQKEFVAKMRLVGLTGRGISKLKDKKYKYDMPYVTCD